MNNIFQTFLYQPILAVLIFIYQNLAFHNLGLAIVFLTILVRVILFPIFYKSAKDQALMQIIQPKIKKIQKDLKNKEEQAKALLELYKEHKFNPFSSFLLLLIQLPIFFALFRIFTKEINGSVFDNLTFLSLINLREPNLIIVFIAAIFQYFQSKLSLAFYPKGQNPSAFLPNPKTMLFIGPIFTVIIFSTLPSALSLYWVVSNVFSIGQQLIINKKVKKVYGGIDPKSTKNP